MLLLFKKFQYPSFTEGGSRSPLGRACPCHTKDRDPLIYWAVGSRGALARATS